MIFFRKKKERYSGYTIDLGKLKEKGIIKAPEAVETQASSMAEATSTDSLGFLGSLASAGNASSVSEGVSEQAPVYNSPYQSQVSSEIGEKLGSISERLYRLIDRIELIERKLERIERKLYPEREY